MTALEHAVKLLSYRSCTRAALLKKLSEKGYSREEAEGAVERLCELRLLDDAQFARTLTRELTARGYGEIRIRRELSRKGVEKQDLDAALEDHEPDLDKMRKLIESKSRGEPVEGPLYGKISRALAARGFSWDDISRVMNEYVSRNDKWE